MPKDWSAQGLLKDVMTDSDVKIGILKVHLRRCFYFDETATFSVDQEERTDCAPHGKARRRRSTMNGLPFSLPHCKTLLATNCNFLYVTRSRNTVFV